MASAPPIPTLAEIVESPYALLASVLPEASSITSVTTEVVSGGLACELNRLHIAYVPQATSSSSTSAKVTLYAKTNKRGEVAEKQATSLGTAREALLYSRFAPRLQSVLPVGSLPNVRFSVGDFSNGRKLILLDEIPEATDSGLVFGMGSPLNWSRAEKVAAAASLATPEEAAASAFSLAARMHALFWNDDTLLPFEWLNGTSARGGGKGLVAGEADFWTSQHHVRDAWKQFLNGEGPAVGVEFDPRLVEAINASLEKTSWTDYIAGVNGGPFTLCHGDFHPGNIVIARRDALHSTLLDFEAIGVGSGPQDLAQYLISHMAPVARRECEHRLLETYHAELVSQGVSDYTFETCWSDYVAGGVGRWVWLLCVIVQMAPAPMCKYFGDQLLAFMLDHDVTKSNIVMPRV